MCGEFARGGLAVACAEKDMGMFVDACAIEMKSSETADVIYHVVGGGANLKMLWLEWG